MLSIPVKHQLYQDQEVVDHVVHFTGHNKLYAANHGNVNPMKQF